MKKTQINLKLREDILEKFDEKAKEEHRTRSNMIEKMIIDYLGERQYWLWVNSSAMDIGDDVKEKDEMTWDGCDPRTLKGDRVLIYRTSPHKHIKYLAEVLDDALEDEIWTQNGDKMGYYCRFRILKSFEEPLEISQMRDYESLEDWYPLKVSFIRMVFKIEEKYWEVLRDILITKNSDAKEAFK
ncbi:EVE domain-containing protein [Methanobacterium sp. CWC-01]|uniref:EVE domain-containing protein n=1 Tax=Methanobacterium aridiramus TaxID=2584467 RepID=UPI0025764727|nr:EVE domain-containing protein [Methanobacterium sp. CWC-01]WJI08805.1 EVE domain-containing protein [Methanobacterium sp. CWC-01]